LKINIIGTGLFKSGGMKIIFEYANRLSIKGHDVIYYYPIKQYTFGKEKFICKARRYYGAVKDHLLNKQEFKNFYKVDFPLKTIPFISNKFVRDADIVLATQWPTAYDVYDLSNQKGKKFYFLQDYEIWGSDVNRVDAALFLDLFKITISNYNKEFFHNRFNIDTFVILNGIDYDLYNVDKKNFEKDEIVISFIEHHLDSKGVNIAIEVVEKLQKDNKNLKFICFGQNKYHKIPEFVKFYQNLTDEDVVSNVYGITDIFIYPSLKEGFALPPAEAMACKCAVVTTTVGAVPEYSIHERTAIHVSPNEPEQLYAAVADLLQNKNKIKYLANNAYSDIRKKLDWNASVALMEELFQKS